MKNLLFLLCVLVYSKTIMAQSYNPMLGDSNTWYEKISMTGYHAPGGITGFYYTAKCYTRGDSALAGRDYKKFFIDDPYSNYDFSPVGFVGLIREDTAARRVWFRGKDSSSEMLIFDFSLKKGDTANLHFGYAPAPVQYFDILKNGKYKATTSRYATLEGTRDYIILSTPATVNYNLNYKDLLWVESLGSLKSPLYFYGPFNGAYNSSGPNHQTLVQVDVSLGCVFRNGIRIYDTAAVCEFDTATVTLGVPDITKDGGNILSFFPNPASDIISVQLAGMVNNAFVQVYDMEGKRVTAQMISAADPKIDISSLKPGVFVLKLQNSPDLFYGRFVKLGD